MRLPITAAIFVTLLSVPAFADDVTQMIDEATKLYKKGKFSESVKELQFAIGEIQQKLSKRLGAKMPPAPPGWMAGETKTQGMGLMGGGQMITRKYTQKGGSGSLTARLVVDNPMIQGISVMLSSPMLIQSQRGMKRVKIKGEEGLIRWRKSRRRGELSVILGGGKLMLQVKGRNVDNREVLFNFMKSWDFKSAKKIVGL